MLATLILSNIVLICALVIKANEIGNRLARHDAELLADLADQPGREREERAGGGGFHTENQ